MNPIRNSMFAKIFMAISATAVLVVMVMALMVAVWMRDGFARYLLKGELARFDELSASLAEAHQGGWPELGDDPRLWHDFLRAHAPQPSLDINRPLGRPPEFLPGRPPGPRSGHPPAFRAGGEHLMLEQRLVLLDRDGAQIAGNIERSAVFERRPICVQNDCTGANLLGYIGLSAPIEQGDASDAFFLRGQYVSLALAALIAIAISAVAAYVIARQLLGPIRRLEVGAKTMAAGDYTARIRQDRTDELGQLIGHYNTLAATLEQTAKAEREWISNTSHELQTPLAVLRAQIEALQDGIRQPDNKTLTEMHAALMRLSRLVQDLKTLSYAREAELASLLANEDLTHIAQQAAETARSKLSAKAIELELSLPPQVSVACDRGQISQVIDNLLENACRYTDGPGKVRVCLQEDEGYALLTVDDTPPAAPEEDVERLFDRFYRVEGSRSRAYGGSGLGLSVCKAIVEAHGGTITAGPSDMGGLQNRRTIAKGTHMTVTRILIVEDEIALAEVVRDYLLAEGMRVDMFAVGTGAVERAQAEHYDLIILDLMLPGVDGLTICRELRKTSDVPIIMTTAKVEEIDRLLGLELGADDYLCKPYSPRELVARVRAVLRRRPSDRTLERSTENTRLSIDGDKWQATLDGTPLDLTRREFSVLQALVARPGRVFSRDQLLSLAFPDDTEVFDRTVDSHIRNMRRKIALVSTWDPIRSVYGVGYAYDG